MSRADRNAIDWLCLAGWMFGGIIMTLHRAASEPPISAAGAGFAFVIVTSFSVCIGAILFGLADDRI